MFTVQCDVLAVAVCQLKAKHCGHLKNTMNLLHREKQTKNCMHHHMHEVSGSNSKDFYTSQTIE